MKFKSAIAVVGTTLMLTACAGTAIGLRSTNSPSIPGSTPAIGSSYGSAAIQADVTPGAFFGLVLLGHLVSGVHEDYLRWRYGSSSRKPPELAEDRTIAERDCSQPLGPLYANLRCK
ncbi:MAG: hypothetical protein EPO19_02070 [Betaproteobacteria bacterium]|nr:MAG: hypothetical protein EPO19_02070 [Betaproteobacteria bacterium]